MNHTGLSDLTPSRRYWLTNWALILIGLIATQGSSAIALIVLARHSEPIAYGRYLACYAFASLLVVLPGLGLDRWLLARGGIERGGVKSVWTPAARARLVALGIWFAGMVAFAASQVSDALPARLLLITAFGLGCESMAMLAYAALRSEGLNAWVVIAQSIASLLLLGLVFSLPTGPKLIFNFAAGRMLLSLGVAAVICTLVTIRYRMIAKRFVEDGTSPNPTSRLLRQALPFMISDIAISVYFRADLIIVSFALGSTGAAVYGPALNMVNMCFLVPFAFNILVLPRLSRAYVETPRTFMRLGRAQLAVQATSGTLMALGMWVLSDLLVELAFGPNYSSSAAILRILSPLVALKACSFGLGNILTAANRQSERTGIQIFVAAFSVLANLSVVQTFGIPGIAIVYACSELLLCGAYALAIRRVSRVVTQLTSSRP